MLIFLFVLFSVDFELNKGDYLHVHGSLFEGQLIINHIVDHFGEEVFGTDEKHWFAPAYSDEDRWRMPALQGLDYCMRLDVR